MKRSEAINIITDWVEIDDKEASFLLTILEKECGMLPPVCTVKVENGKHTPTERKWDEE